MIRTRGQLWIPAHLRIQMGMQVDKTRRNGLPGCINGFPRGMLTKIAKFRDPTVFDRHIALIRGAARAVNNGAAGDDCVVVHWFTPETVLGSLA